MHDFDRALQEFGPGASEQESQSYEDNEEEAAGAYEAEASYESEGEYEGEGEYESEAEYEAEGEYEAEAGYEAESDYEADQEGGFNLAGESGTDTETVFDELEEMEQAAALLEAQNEGEVEQFLGGLVDKVRKKLGKIVPAKVKQALVANLKRVAGAALPKAGALLGNFVAPGIGGAIGGTVAANAAKMFGLELEGMSYEDQEFEVARRVVGLGVDATKAASQAVQTGMPAPAMQVAKDAVVSAARTHAPGLAAAAMGASNGRRPYGSGGGGRRRSGRWYRRGGRIILVGL